jgi:hypothetical protein
MAHQLGLQQTSLPATHGAYKTIPGNWIIEIGAELRQFHHF